MRFGLDLLGLAQYKSVALKNFPNNTALGCFMSEFGDALPAVEAILKTGKCPLVRFQLIWDRTHSYGDKHLPELKKQSIRCERLKQKYPNIIVEISGFCEHTLSNPDKYCKIVAALAPHCEIINSPVSRLPDGRKGALSKVFKNEVHGSHAGPISGRYNFSFDGNDAFNSDIESIKANLNNAENFFLWMPAFNLHRDENDKTRNSPPTSGYMQGALYLFGTKGVCKLPKNALWKPMSEKWKPCLIAPVKTSKVLLKRNGKTIVTMPYYGSYIDGRSRYYTNGVQGYQIGQVEVWINGKKYGDVDAGFRVNDYR